MFDKPCLSPMITNAACNLFQNVKVHSLVTRPQEDCCCFLPDLNFHRGQTESLPPNYYIGGSTESPPSNYYIGGSTCIMTSMYRVK